MLDLTGIWFNTDGDSKEIIVIRQVMTTLNIFCIGKRDGMDYENFGYGRLENKDQKDEREVTVTWAYTHASQGGKKGVVHKTTIWIESEDLLYQVEDELLTHCKKAKPDVHYGNWRRGQKMKIDSGGLLCLI